MSHDGNPRSRTHRARWSWPGAVVVAAGFGGSAWTATNLATWPISSDAHIEVSWGALAVWGLLALSLLCVHVLSIRACARWARSWGAALVIAPGLFVSGQFVWLLIGLTAGVGFTFDGVGVPTELLREVP